MTGILKTILIVIVVIVGLGILLVIQENNRGAIGIPGVIIAFAGWAAIKAIRNYESEDKKTDDIHKLDKD